MTRIAVIASIAVVMTAAPVRSEDAKIPTVVNDSDPWAIAVHDAIERGAPDAAFAMVLHMHEVYNSRQGFGRWPANWWDKMGNVEHARRLAVAKLARDYSSTQRSLLSETRSSQGSSARPLPVNAQGKPFSPGKAAVPAALIRAVREVRAANPPQVPGTYVGAGPSEGKALYDADLIEAANGIFGPYLSLSNEAERQRWLYEEQKERNQRRIENEINRSKPLVFPVGTH